MSLLLREYLRFSFGTRLFYEKKRAGKEITLYSTKLISDTCFSNSSSSCFPSGTVCSFLCLASFFFFLSDTFFLYISVFSLSVLRGTKVPFSTSTICKKRFFTVKVYEQVFSFSGDSFLVFGGVYVVFSNSPDDSLIFCGRYSQHLGFNLKTAYSHIFN